MAASPYFSFCCLSYASVFNTVIDVELPLRLQILPDLGEAFTTSRDGEPPADSDNLRELAPRIIAHFLAIQLPDTFDASTWPKVPTLVTALLVNHPYRLDSTV
jgi:hypothetical protein